MHEKLTAPSKRLKDEQRDLLLAAAEQNTIPSASTIQRVAMLELNIAPLRIPSRTKNDPSGLMSGPAVRRSGTCHLQELHIFVGGHEGH
ncbi:MAG: hypothetical protein EOQ56_36450 [Mesorhizobium sp.]|nr:MAG: hypothetical protein EOQ56_36450 [Mesorhizobium sp.]